MIGTSVASVRSTTTNVGKVSHSDFVSTMIEMFESFHGKVAQTFEITDGQILNCPGLNNVIYELRSWDWIFGKGPKFQLDFPHGQQISVENGHIVGINCPELSHVKGNKISCKIISQLLSNELPHKVLSV